MSTTTAKTDFSASVIFVEIYKDAMSILIVIRANSAPTRLAFVFHDPIASMITIVATASVVTKAIASSSSAVMMRNAMENSAASQVVVCRPSSARMQATVLFRICSA